MYCSFCGKEIPDGAKFCSECGKNLQPVASDIASTKPKSKKTFSNKKVVISIVSIVSILLAITLVAVCISMTVTSKSIKRLPGVWKSAEGGDTYTFSSKYFKVENDRLGQVAAGAYSVDLSHDEDETYRSLTLEMRDGRRAFYKFDKKACTEQDSKTHYWYISGSRLYIDGEVFIKQNG